LVLEAARRAGRADRAPAGAGRHAHRHLDATVVVDAQLVARVLRRVTHVRHQRRTALPHELHLILRILRILDLQDPLRRRHAAVRRLADALAAILRITRILRAGVAVLAVEVAVERAVAAAVALVHRADAVVGVARGGGRREGVRRAGLAGGAGALLGDVADAG